MLTREILILMRRDSNAKRASEQDISNRKTGSLIFESKETVILKRGGKKVIDFCPRCQTEVEMLAPDVLSMVTGSGEREIFRLIEAGYVHFTEHDRVLACISCCHESLAGNRNPQIREAVVNDRLLES